jgi:UDP-glucose 6-dehydrogenase
VNIALVNELAILSDRMGVDMSEIVDAASTKPYGFMRFELHADAGYGRRRSRWCKKTSAWCPMTESR